MEAQAYVDNAMINLRNAVKKEKIAKNFDQLIDIVEETLNFSKQQRVTGLRI